MCRGEQRRALRYLAQVVPLVIAISLPWQKADSSLEQPSQYPTRLVNSRST